MKLLTLHGREWRCRERFFDREAYRKYVLDLKRRIRRYIVIEVLSAFFFAVVTSSILAFRLMSHNTGLSSSETFGYFICGPIVVALAGWVGFLFARFAIGQYNRMRRSANMK